MILILNIIALISGLVAAFQMGAGKRNFITSTLIFCVAMILIALSLSYYAVAIFNGFSIVFYIVTWLEWNKNANGAVSHASKLTRKGKTTLALSIIGGFALLFLMSYAVQHDTNLTRIIFVDAMLFTLDVATLPLVIKKKTAGPVLWLIIDVLWNIFLFWFVVLEGNWDYLPLYILRIYFIATTIMAIVLWNRQVPKRKGPTFFINEQVPSMSKLNESGKKKNKD